MTDTYYVIFNRHGIDRMLKTDKFTLKAGEHAVQMILEVPDEVFVKPRIPVTRITIDPSQVTRDSGVETPTEEQGNNHS